MSKKVVFGCLGAVVGVGLIIAVLLYVFLLRPILGISGDFREVAKMHEQESEILNQDPFTPPEDGHMTPEQLERFVRVQNAMREDMASGYAELRDRAAKVRTLLAEIDDEEGEDMGFREALDTLKGLGKVLPEAKKIQIRALNQEGFSNAEYRWVREAFYYALGQEHAGIYVEDLARDLLKDGKSFDAEMKPGTRIVPEANRNLAVAYLDSLDSWTPFLVFGL